MNLPLLTTLLCGILIFSLDPAAARQRNCTAEDLDWSNCAWPSKKNESPSNPSPEPEHRLVPRSCEHGICRNKDQKKAIHVMRLPETIHLEAGETVSDIHGFWAQIDLTRVEVGTPASQLINPQVIDGNDDHNASLTCTEINKTKASFASENLPHALLPLTVWKSLYKKYQLMINANWFYIGQGFRSPHIDPCTNIHGYAVSDETGSVVSAADVRDGGNLLDALLIGALSKTENSRKPAKIVANAEIKDYAKPKAAVGGFMIMRNGAYVPSPDPSNLPENPIARTAVGMTGDPTRLYIVVIQGGKTSHGLRARQMFSFFRHNFHALDVINLDNSGSSQLLYYEPPSSSTPTYQTREGDYADCNKPLRIPCTSRQIGDRERVLRHRPVPNFLGITAKPSVEKRALPSRKADKVVGTALPGYRHIGQQYSNSPYLYDDGSLPWSGTIEDCAEKCTLIGCRYFSYAYADSPGRGQYCTLFDDDMIALPTTSDYQMYEATTEE